MTKISPADEGIEAARRDANLARRTETEWTTEIAKVLVGQTIAEVFYMSEELADEWGWSKRPLVIHLSNGHELIISQDDEGNDGGSILTTFDHPLSIIPVM